MTSEKTRERRGVSKGERERKERAWREGKGKGRSTKERGESRRQGRGKDRVTEPREERGWRYSGEPAVPMLQNCSNKSTGERAQKEHLARERLARAAS